jgi:hypothetical protein
VRWTGGLAAVLAAGLAIGYFARGQVVHTRTATVVQIVTTAAPPPPTQTLTAIIQGPNGGCLGKDLTTHTFSLRSQSNGFNEGNILALSKTASTGPQGCIYTLTFSINPSLGFFYVYDELLGTKWGPFDSQAMAARGWLVRLYEPS